MQGRSGLAVVALVLVFSATARSEPRHRQRDVVSAEETVGVPPGFHAETRPRYGPLIGGAAATGFGAAMLLTGLDQRAQIERARTPQDPGAGGEIFMIWGIMSMAVGLPFLVYGFASPRHVYVRDSVSLLSTSVSATPRQIRAGLTLAF
jgi:hypothetical protein